MRIASECAFAFRRSLGIFPAMAQKNGVGIRLALHCGNKHGDRWFMVIGREARNADRLSDAPSLGGKVRQGFKVY